MDREFAARGFNIPPGAQVQRILQVRQENRIEIRSLTRDQGIQRATLEIDNVKFAVTEGEAAQEIVDTAASHKVQMIVMGTRGLSGLDHVLLGSVTGRVIRKAKVPVLAVK